jgi:hypothetical protein
MQERLDQKERELARKESELQKLEIELRNSPAAKSVKNWPKFCPIAHHDIAGEIPAHLQVMVKFAYWSFLVRRERCRRAAIQGCWLAAAALGPGHSSLGWPVGNRRRPTLSRHLARAGPRAVPVAQLDWLPGCDDGRRPRVDHVPVGQ